MLEELPGFFIVSSHHSSLEFKFSPSLRRVYCGRFYRPKPATVHEPLPWTCISANLRVLSRRLLVVVWCLPNTNRSGKSCPRLIESEAFYKGVSCEELEDRQKVQFLKQE
ncbi:hypothetical protein LXL04_021177 [Taraxacum kok-saghyz]